MPSGRTHLKIEMIGLLIGAIAVAVLVVEGRIDAWLGGVFLSAYLFSSLFLSPDLDLHNSRATKRWGIARAFWLPYSWVFRHRAVSHHLLFGPLTRIAYLGGILLLILWGIGLFTGRSLRPALPSWSIFLAALCGLYLPNQIHIVVDRLVSFHRHR
ncbi:DUF2227 family putative metal-binding protein [Candidatus Bipolaricaulota bacterium]|nr:DUF2227 family putative metal-binding protein [Candidatus Bipolaricaulota bacterium]